jgi:hypothetical protein
VIIVRLVVFILCEDVLCILGLLSAPEIAFGRCRKELLAPSVLRRHLHYELHHNHREWELVFFSAGFICTQGNDASQLLMLFSPCVEEEEQSRLCLTRSPYLQD